ncbi:MAG: hypothetical protein HZB75_02475 [Candidatus Saccharibacteria bacterium]|nr:MAG: hypothetical protein HZB75_02475 [Candidatus Saccharibacteria bacterium]
MSESCKQPITTDQVDWKWQKTELDRYRSGNYLRLAPEDIYVGSIAIAALAAHARHQDLFGALPHGTLIAAGGVPRGAAVIAPLIKTPERGGFIDVSDREISTTDLTRDTMSRLALGDLGIWTPHQKDYTAAHPDWDGSFQLAGRLASGHVHTEDMRELAKNSRYAIAVEHGPESATESKDEYEEFMRFICRALLPGGIFYMAYMRGSRGYEVGGVPKPAIPVDVDGVTDILHNNNMHVLFNGGTDPSNSIREDGDEHTYSGLGVAVAVKK